MDGKLLAMKSRLRRSCLAVVLILLLSACVDSDQSTTPEAKEGPCVKAPVSSEPSPGESPDGEVSFATGKAILEGDEGSVLLDIEIADSPEQQQQGLMGRSHLDECSGMVFIFFEETSGSFWMKDTLIPLSIAFFDSEGKIVRILDMEPCEADPCPTYDPETAYIGALEVNQGAFDTWSIEEGDSVRVIHDARDGLQ